MNHIRYIQHEEIDKAKWDSCIANAGNSLIYGYTWWLDNISPGWHALVLNDYDAVMPLTWRKKYGFFVESTGCIIYEEDSYYNEVVDEYLQKKNGKNWENQYEKEVALIIKKYPIKEIER